MYVHMLWRVFLKFDSIPWNYCIGCHNQTGYTDFLNWLLVSPGDISLCRDLQLRDFWWRTWYLDKGYLSKTALQSLQNIATMPWESLLFYLSVLCIKPTIKSFLCLWMKCLDAFHFITVMIILIWKEKINILLVHQCISRLRLSINVLCLIYLWFSLPVGYSHAATRVSLKFLVL